MPLNAPIDIVRMKTPDAESDCKDANKIFQKDITCIWPCIWMNINELESEDY
jgi:hypothetical protein